MFQEIRLRQKLFKTEHMNWNKSNITENESVINFQDVELLNTEHLITSENGPVIKNVM